MDVGERGRPRTKESALPVRVLPVRASFLKKILETGAVRNDRAIMTTQARERGKAMTFTKTHNPRMTVHKIDDHRTLTVDETQAHETVMEAWVVDYDGNDSLVDVRKFTPGTRTIPRNLYLAEIVYDTIIQGYEIS